MNYAARLITGAVAVLVVTVLVLVVGADRSLRRDLFLEEHASLEREAGLVREALALEPDSAGWQPLVHRIAAASGLRVTVIDRSGRVRAESGVDPAELPRVENHSTRPEVAAALAGRTGSDVRTSSTVGEPFVYLAVPGGPGVIRVAMPAKTVESTVRRAQRLVLAAAALALILGIGLAWIAARRIARPLGELGSAAQAIAKGQTPHIEMTGIPDVDGLAGHLRDMHAELTARFAALTREQAETRAIVDSMVEGVLAADARGEITTANPAARRLLGYGEAEPLPPLPILFRSKEAREALDGVLAGGSVADREVTLADRTYLLNAKPLPAGGMVVVIHDLTHLKRLEAVRRDFVANASHELKTPLTAISGYTETLLSDQPDPDTSRQFLETILANARRMQRLVDDQLDLSRIESGGWTAAPERTAVEPTAHDAWSFAVPRTTPAPSLTVDVEPGAEFVAADPDALSQVFRNLLENAIRYTPATGTVSVTANLDQGLVRVCVTDTGTGMASEHLPRIFERFYRVDAGRSRDQGGTGLGLAIVKHLVEAHGGRVEAESQLGRGTTIRTWWPSAPTT